MTRPDPATLEREKDKLWISDIELIRRMGVPEKIARMRLKALDDNPKSGFPKKDKFFGNRRYLPAVLAWFDKYTHIEPQGGANDRRKTA